MNHAALADIRRRAALRRALPAPSERRRLRREARISLDDIAAAVGVTRECIRLWEVGKQEPHDRHVEPYLRALEALGLDDHHPHPGATL